MGRSAKRLYEGWVCKKCVYAFTNRRQAAYLIDSLAVYLLLMGVDALLLYAEFDLSAIDSAIRSLPTIFAVVLFLLYSNTLYLPFYFKDGFAGRSPGKWLTGVSVVHESTFEPIRWGASFKRNILLIIPFAVLVGLIQMTKGKRLGDGVAGTRVIWDKYRHRFPFDPRGFVCRQCGYDLRGNTSGRCSECGTSIPQGAAVDPFPGAAQ